MGMSKPITHDAGISSDPKVDSVEINDQGGKGNNEVSKSPKAVTVIPNHIISNKIVEGSTFRMNFADGGVRPGTTK